MRALHLFDGSADWEQRIAVTQLLDRLRADDETPLLASEIFPVILHSIFMVSVRG